MRNTSFAKGALILAVAGMIAKLLGAIYRIPLTNILGAEGIGKYQLVFPLFALLLAICCNSIPVAVSRMVASDRARGLDQGIRNTVGTSLLIMLAAGIICIGLVWIISPYLAVIQGIDGLEKCYRVLAPAILFVGLSGVFKGWFLGLSNTYPSAVSQLIEQISKLVVGIILAKMLMPKGVIMGVAGALVGVSISELAGLITLSIWYCATKHSTKGISFADPLFGLYRLSKTATPIMLSSLVFPVVSFVDSILIVKLLIYSGVDGQMAVTQYGLLTGPVATLVNMPVVISLSIAVAIVPAVSSHLATYDVTSIKQKTALSVKLAYLIGLPCAIGMWILSGPILRLLYPTMSVLESSLATRLLRVQSLAIVFLSQLEVFNATLQGLDKSTRVLVNVAIGGVVKIAMESVLIYRIGIVGASVAVVVFYALSGLLDIVLYNKLLGKNQQLLKSIGKIALSSVIMTIAIVPLSIYSRSDVISVIAVPVVGAAVYLTTTAILKVFDGEELKSLPLVGKRKRKGEGI